MAKQISDNEIYLLIKYIKSVLWRVVKRLSYIQDARCLKVNFIQYILTSTNINVMRSVFLEQDFTCIQTKCKCTHT